MEEAIIYLKNQLKMLVDQVKVTKKVLKDKTLTHEANGYLTYTFEYNIKIIESIRRAINFLKCISKLNMKKVYKIFDRHSFVDEAIEVDGILLDEEYIILKSNIPKIVLDLLNIEIS